MPSLLLGGSHFDAFQKEIDSLFKQCSRIGAKKRVEAAENANVFFANLSNQIVSYSKKLYLKINVEEFTSKDKPNINALAKYTAQLSYLVSASILQQKGRSKRNFCYEMWAKCMHHCFELGDYTGAFAIYNGLNLFFMDKYVKRKNLSDGAKSIFSEYSGIFEKMLNPAKTFNMHKKLGQGNAVIPQLTGIVASLESARQIFSDNKAELATILENKFQTELEIKKLLEIITIFKPLQPSPQSEFLTMFCQSCMAQHRELMSKYSEIKEQYEEIVKEYGGDIPNTLRDVKNVQILTEFLSSQQNTLVNSLEVRQESTVVFSKMLEESKSLNEEKLIDFSNKNCSKSKSKRITKNLSKIFPQISPLNFTENIPSGSETKDVEDGNHQAFLWGDGTLNEIKSLIDKSFIKDKPKLSHQRACFFDKKERELVKPLNFSAEVNYSSVPVP